MPHHKPMTPDDFELPVRIDTGFCLVRPLTTADAAADYEAWSTSIDELQGIFGPGSSWPTSDMTLEENVIDLAWHQREHESRSSYCFTVFDAADVECMGCIYLSPARKVGWDAEAYWWVRASATADFTAKLDAWVENWIGTWPLGRVA